MIFRGTESLQYPSRKEFRQLSDMMHQLRTIHSQAQLPSLTSMLGQLIPYQFSACGAFSISKCELHIGHTNYDAELNGLYVAHAFATDPSLKLLRTTRIHTVSSEDCVDLLVPKEIANLKLDFGIRTCLSVGVRGALCSYFAFSNFDHRLLWKLRTMMQILGPHLHLAYMEATRPLGQDVPSSKKPALTAREEEIMRWIADGKTNWEISVILGVSLNTVKFHLKNIYQKLGGVENRWAAVAHWQRTTAGSVPLDLQRHQNEGLPKE